MSKNKERKKKDRERRVAQKKIATAQKRVQEKTAREGEAAFPKTKKAYSVETLPKATNLPANANKKSPFSHRRSGGG